MRSRWCRDGHAVDTGHRQRVSEREQRPRHVEEAGPLGGLVWVPPHDGQHIETRRAQGADVGVTPEPGTDDSNACHDSCPVDTVLASTSASSDRVASAATPAASAGPFAWRSSEKTSTPMGARTPMRPERHEIPKQVEGALTREEPVVQRRLDQVLLRLRRTVVDLHGQHPFARHPEQVVHGRARAGAVPHVDVESSVGAVGLGHDREGRLQVGDPRPRQPFQVHQ